jgi:hypothetical protein
MLIRFDRLSLGQKNFARRQEGKHLPYALALEINNSIFVQFTRFATSSTWTRAVLEGTEIPATALTDFRGLFDITINNWRKISSTDSLSQYSSPPSTWVPPEAAKEAAKKAAKTSENSSPSSKSIGRSGNAPSQQSAASRPSARDPTFGMIVAPDNIRHGPQLPRGKRLCLHFAIQGKACTNGYTCTNAHVTLNRTSIPDLKAIERWVTDTAQVDWAVGHPKRLGEASSARTPESPQASSTPAQVFSTGGYERKSGLVIHNSNSSIRHYCSHVHILSVRLTVKQAGISPSTNIENLSTQEIFARAAASADPPLPPSLTVSPPLTNPAVKRLLTASRPKPTIPPTQREAKTTKLVAPTTRAPTRTSTTNTLPPLLDGDNSDDDSDDEDELPTHSKRQPRLTKSMNPRFFDKSVMGKAWQAQKKQTFGKDNLFQTYTTEPVLLHIVLPVLKQGFLTPEDMCSLSQASSPVDHLWTEYQRVKDLDWTPLCEPNPNWQTQAKIDDARVDLRMAMLFHYDMDLAAVH